MPTLNRCLVMGNICSDPETRHTPGGKAVCSFRLAVNDYGKDAQGERTQESVYLDVDAWERQAEVVEKYCRKGSALFVEGRLKMDTWDDKATGAKRSKIKVIANNVQLLDKKDDANGDTVTRAPARALGNRSRNPDPILDPEADPDQIPF